jgi:hypothetical protein
MTIIDNPNEREINYGNGYVDIKSSTIVKLNELFIVHSEDGPVELRVEISADFNTIDEKYHEIFLNVLSSKYLNRVSFGDNPFSECKPLKKRKWYQFWKSKYFI